MAEKPLALDLFCGKGGWTNGLLEAGFEVIGFDLIEHPEYKGQFHRMDVLTLDVDGLKSLGAKFAVCSSPCEEFSVHCMKHFHPNPKYPEMGIRLFNHSRALLEGLGIPYVMENVRCAEQFVGKATNHCGPFYLWGNAVPALFSKEAYKVQKGISMGGGLNFKDMPIEERRIHRANSPFLATHSKSPERKALTANAAAIPSSIARAVALGAKQIIEVGFDL
jgi:hypothetical protein